MVQRCDEDDLGRRFSRVELVKMERRRQEKTERLFVVGNDPVKRILFESDLNLQGWIDGELGKIAESHHHAWNFDFKRGVPADIPGHNWEWESVRTPPRRAVKTPARSPSLPSSASKVPRVTISPKAGTSSQKKITEFMTTRKYPEAVSPKLKTAKSSLGQSSSGEEENNPTQTAQ